MTLQPGATCEERVYETWHIDVVGHKCGKKAYALGSHFGKMIPMCHMHHPDDRESRRLGRGPTQWQRELDARIKTNRKAAKFDGLVEALEEAWDVLHQVHPNPSHIPIGKGICEWGPCKKLGESLDLAKAP